MTTPKTMQAVAIDSYGGKELLKLRELPIPEMSPAEVLIKVEAAGVGVWDAIVRQAFMKDVAPAAFRWFWEETGRARSQPWAPTCRTSAWATRCTATPF
jgi:hypothetical protein